MRRPSQHCLHALPPTSAHPELPLASTHMWEAVSILAPRRCAMSAAPCTSCSRKTSSALAAGSRGRWGGGAQSEKGSGEGCTVQIDRLSPAPRSLRPKCWLIHCSAQCHCRTHEAAPQPGAPMSTGAALATLPTSSSDCIIFLMRACRLELLFMPLPAMAAGRLAEGVPVHSNGPAAAAGRQRRREVQVGAVAQGRRHRCIGYNAMHNSQVSRPGGSAAHQRMCWLRVQDFPPGVA